MTSGLGSRESQGGRKLAPDKRSLTITVSKKLRILAVELESILSAKAELTAREDRAKKEIRKILESYELPESTGKTQSLPIPELGGRPLTVTIPEETIKPDPEKLLALIGWENFRKVVTIKDIGINLPVWDLLVEEELVTNSDLLNSLPLNSTPPTPRIGFGKTKG